MGKINRMEKYRKILRDIESQITHNNAMIYYCANSYQLNRQYNIIRKLRHKRNIMRNKILSGRI